MKTKAQVQLSEEEKKKILEDSMKCFFCPAARGEPCNIVEIAEALIARSNLNRDVQPNNAPADWREIANAGHDETNYEELLQELPNCGDPHLDTGDPCDNRMAAYELLKLATG